MIEINKATIGIAAGVAGTLFIGYCIYFDKKRRHDPEYKKKVRERRNRIQKSSAGSNNEMPDRNDHQALERFFLQNIELGENLIARGDFESGVEHLANAMVVCAQPQRLFQLLQNSLPPQVFAMLVMKMQELNYKLQNQQASGPRIVAASSVPGGIPDNIFAAASIDDLE